MDRIPLIERHPAAMLERARAKAYPGREGAEINHVLREIRRLLDHDARRRLRSPISIPKLRCLKGTGLR